MIAASVFVRAWPICMSISQARADLKRFQVRPLLKGPNMSSEDSNSLVSCNKFQQADDIDSLTALHQLLLRY